MNVAITKVGSNQLEFDGWPVDLNSFNGEFDEAARERMIKGGKCLLKYIHSYKEKLGKYILEIGPFFNPLVTREMLEESQRLAYWENDLYALRELKERQLCNQVFPVACDINEIGKVEFKFGSCPVFVESQNLKVYSGKYDSIIMSQFFNYIHYQEFIAQIRRFINPGGLVFINNVVNYGIPEFFSAERPVSIEETIRTLQANDFEIVEKEVLPPPRPNDDNRLLLVAEYKGTSPLLP